MDFFIVGRCVRKNSQRELAEQNGRGNEYIFVSIPRAKDTIPNN